MRFSVSVTIIVFCLVACGTVGAQTAQVGPRGIPDLLTEKGKDVTALKAVVAVATAYDGGKERQDIRGFLMYRRPSDFRFQGIAASGNSLFELVLDHRRFELFIPTEGKIIRGGKQCFRQRLPDVAELQNLIPLALLQWREVKLEKVVSTAPDSVTLAIAFRGDQWLATVDRANLHVSRLERRIAGKPEVVADFGEFGKGKPGWLPRRFDVRSAVGRWRTVVAIRKLVVNPFLVEKDFKLDTPFSVKIEECP